MRQIADQGNTHTLHHKGRRCKSTDWEIKAGLRGPRPPFDPPTSGAPLKSPPSSHILCPLSSLWTQPWDAECTLSNSVDSEKQRVKEQRSVLNLRPLRFTPDTSFLCRALLPTGSTGVSWKIHSNSSLCVFPSAWDFCCTCSYLCTNMPPTVQHIVDTHLECKFTCVCKHWCLIKIKGMFAAPSVSLSVCFFFQNTRFHLWDFKITTTLFTMVISMY